MMSAVSQWLYMDLKYESPTKGTSNDWNFSWPCCHPESWPGDLEHTTCSTATGKQLAELRWRSRNELPRPGGWQEFWAAQLQFHNTLASVTKPSCWVLPPASALLPCAGVHDSLLQTQLLSSLLSKLHRGERKHLRWHLFWSIHLTHVSLICFWHSITHSLQCNWSTAAQGWALLMQVSCQGQHTTQLHANIL